MDRVTLPRALARASADPSTLLTSARLAATKGVYTQLQMGPTATNESDPSDAATGAAAASASACNHGMSAVAASGSGPGVPWYSYTLDDLLGPKSPAATVRYQTEEQTDGMQSAATPTPAATNVTLRSTRLRASLTPFESCASLLLLDARCAGPDALAKICALPASFLAAPVYTNASASAAASTIAATSTPAAAAAASGAPPPPSCEFVGVTSVLDCAQMLLRALQKMKANSLPPGQDHSPVGLASDAALLVDLTGSSPFIPLDVATSRPIAALVSLFAQGAQRVCCMECGEIRCERDKFRGMVTQHSVLSFLHARHTDWGEIGARTAGELGLITPIATTQACIEWGDTTVISALQSWLQAPGATIAPLPSLPLCFQGCFVDALTPADLRGLLASRMRSEFYTTVYELKWREAARVAHLREMEARRSLRAATRQLSFGGATTAAGGGAGGGGGAAFITESPSAASSRSGSGNSSRSSSRRNSGNNELTQSLAAAFATALASGSGGNGGGNGNSEKKPPPRLPDSGLRIPLRKKSLDTGHEDEFARAVRLNGSKPASGSFLPRIRSAQGSREGSPERDSDAGAGATSSHSARTRQTPTHSRRRTMPSQSFAALYAQSGGASPLLPPPTRLHASPSNGSLIVSNSTSSIVSPPQPPRHVFSHSRRSSHARLPSFGSAGSMTNEVSAGGSTPSRRSVAASGAGATPPSRLGLSASASSSLIFTSPSSSAPVVPLDEPVASLGSRGSVSTMMRRRSSLGEPVRAAAGFASPPHPPPSAGTAPASDSALSARRAKRATLPSGFFPSLTASNASSATQAAPETTDVDIAALMASLRSTPASSTVAGGGGSDAVAPSFDRAPSLSSSSSSLSAAASSSPAFSIGQMSQVATGMVVGDDTPFALLVERMVRAEVACLWRVNAQGKVDGCVTGTEIFRCLQQHAPSGATGMPAPQISHFGLNLD